MPAKAIIISIGDEILYGQTLDTNSHWISGELDRLGIRVHKKVTISDTREVILENIKEAEENADIVLITGGLGPTNDDLTKPCLAEYFNTPLVRNEEAYANIKAMFEKAGWEMTESNEEQADLPANCKAINNPIGTASGMWFDSGSKVIVSMPGVPFEMKHMMSETVLPRLKEQFVMDGIFHRMIRTIGIGESKLAEIIKEWETNLPKEIKLAYLPTMGAVKLRLTTDDDSEAMQKKVQDQIDAVLPLIEKYVYGFDKEEVSEAIGRILKESNQTLAIAESCTGGYLSHQVTSIAGSSHWFRGSMVPYSNDLKRDLLGVDQKILDTDGAVSEAVVLALAENVRKTLKSDVGVSVSGVAGPGGGSEEKPVGTVWIGYSDKNKSVAKKFRFIRDREINIKYSAIAALNMIRINLDKD
ncbi:competence/damage-inducible protein A [Ekhidna sp. To15]|uniref:competence/damage-inducible protein A n=1 Tax=Ekhidna sp. To15 TaxID=3395267 RepID=UPI003F5237B6